MIKYRNYWPNFDPGEHLFHSLFASLGRPISVIGPFKEVDYTKRLKDFLLNLIVASGYLKRADFFITGENKPPQFNLAKKQIGFWRSFHERDDVFRFPYWMWHLDWPDLRQVPDYPRYGMPLSIERLMLPICKTYAEDHLSSRFNRAVLLSMHLREPRKRLYELTLNTIGCDGFGGAFGDNTRKRAKMPIMEGYRFSLCPENEIGDGYITEKIPEAFHSGCIPITWCRPDDLQEDFNPRAVVNLYDLDDLQVNEILTEVSQRGALYTDLLKQPLLLRRPTLTPLIKFISGD